MEVSTGECCNVISHGESRTAIWCSQDMAKNCVQEKNPRSTKTNQASNIDMIELEQRVAGCSALLLQHSQVSHLNSFTRPTLQRCRSSTEPMAKCTKHKKVAYNFMKSTSLWMQTQEWPTLRMQHWCLLENTIGALKSSEMRYHAHTRTCLLRPGIHSNAKQASIWKLLKVLSDA